MRMTQIVMALGLALCAGTSQAQETPARLALVVGNAAYAQITSLDNPGNDAALMGDRLESAGFEVQYLLDATQSDLTKAVIEFGRDLRARGPETVGLFYYAGHGVQSQGKNYLMPVDANLTDAADLDFVAVQADLVLRQMGSAKNSTNIVILDACRNNPFAALEGLEKNGLAEMKAEQGTFLSYSTGPGNVALDGLGQHSPFTAALAQEMLTPGSPIEQVFKKVRIDVVGETRGIQTPWDTSLLTTDFVFFESDAVAERKAQEAADWAEVEQANDPAALVRFLRTHPQGQFAGQARAQIRAAVGSSVELAKAQARSVAPIGTLPSGSETALFETARLSSKLADYLAYIDAFPAGAYADLVQLEINARR